ncbi:hypothetical protein [Amycolatopsis kentuckyensis]|uniref:hypothetical protein n=1 Tax=Amycolatopsis kentuckyensis TaxID=218823 RepID=UPI003569CA49
MLWWGRIGKLGQFTGGLVAILDIIGVARVSAWGERLRARPIGEHRRTFADALRHTRQIFEAVYLGRKIDRRFRPEVRRVRRFMAISSVLVCALFLVGDAWFETHGGGQVMDIAFFVGGFLVVGIWNFVVLTGALAVAVFANLVSRAWPLVVYALFVWPALMLLRGPQPDRSLRVIGVLLVVAGFGFDLLAS